MPCDGRPTKERDLRDEFALAALAAVLRDYLHVHNETVANKCYQIADAMLWERDKT